jgi:hypothetical protein
MPGYGQYHPEAQGEIRQAMEAIEERYEVSKQKRLELSRILSRLSPVGAYVHATTGLAQTGIEDEKRYHSQLKQNEAQMSVEAKRLFEDAFRGTGAGNPPPREDLHAYRAWLVKRDEITYNGFRDGYSGMLNLTFRKSSLLETLQIIQLDLLLLVLWMGFGFVFATLAVVKCEVR